MLTKLEGGYRYDPDQGLDGQAGDIFIRDGRIVVDPGPGARFDAVYNIRGCIVMAGAIDIHTHIAGGNVNNARLLLPERQIAMASARQRGWTAAGVGERYAQMGYTTLVEPAVLPCSAWQVHSEMEDIPIVDTAGLAILGNDDYLLRLFRDDCDQQAVNDYVAWVLEASRCLGIKVINAGGSNAFKQNVRSFGLDDTVPTYGVTSRRIIQRLQRAIMELGVAHPLHVHCNNLGMAGNVDTAVATMEAAEGLPMHLAHVQFYGYGSEGGRGFSPAAARLIEAWRRHPNITMDVGQVLFQPTVTISGDLIAQFNNRHAARPNKWVLNEAECEGGGGVVPYEYKSQSFVNTLQWAIGLELFLLADDPARLFFTTDHPNGAPFTRYPDLIRLLMDADHRAEIMATVNQEALAMTLLPGLKREYSYYELAIMTRSAAARLLGLADRGNLLPGNVADIAVYTPQDDKSAMFRHATLVFRRGELVIKDGEVVASPRGRALCTAPEYAPRSLAGLRNYYDQYMTVSLNHLMVDIHNPAYFHADRFMTIKTPRQR